MWGTTRPKEFPLRRQLTFVNGGWLEALITQMVEESGIADELMSSLYVNPKLSPKSEFEVDVAVRVGRRLALLSVTTSSGVSQIKSKAIEARERVTQMGGDLATAAVVSLGETNHLARIADGLKRPSVRLFGKDDVTAWTQGDLRTLKAFLEPS